MTEIATSYFEYKGTVVVLRKNITFNDHLERIQNVLCSVICQEVAKHSQMPTENDDIWQLARDLSKSSIVLQEIGGAALDAIVELGYDRNRVALYVNKWLVECAERGLQAMRNPEIYGDVPVSPQKGLDNWFRPRTAKSPAP